MTKYTIEQAIQAERLQAQKVQALYAIMTELQRMRGNYPQHSPEQEVYSRILQYCKIAHRIYTEA